MISVAIFVFVFVEVVGRQSRSGGPARIKSIRRTYPYRGGAVGIVHRLAAETILVPPSAHQALRCERNVQSCSAHLLPLARSRGARSFVEKSQTQLSLLNSCRDRYKRTRIRSVISGLHI